MKASIILAHPHKGSFNHAIAETAAATLREMGFEIYYRDLYSDKFNPVTPYQEIIPDGGVDSLIQACCVEIAASDAIVIVHPNWWGQPPAILKGWVDRVLRQGVAFEFSEGGESLGKLKARAALILNTANTPLEKELELYGDPLDAMWKTQIFGLCGVKKVHRRLYAPVIISTPEQRKKWLEDAKDAVKFAFHIK
jgi:putative NADPH-quinone reductase